VRKVLALALSLAVQAAGLQAPLVHAHPDDHATEHHAGRALHSHWGGHASKPHAPEGPAAGAPDHDRAVFVGAFAAVAVAAFPAPAVADTVATLPVPPERAAHNSIDISPGHDPPSARSLPTRAPPRLPVLI
jgi:hypothetical protein